MKRPLSLFKNCDSGIALIEFALIFPVLLLMLVGMVEATRYTLIHQKLDKLTNAMSDFLTQNTNATVPLLQSFEQAVSPIMSPFTFSGTIIYSSIVNNTTATPPCGKGFPCVSWQYENKMPDGAASHIGQTGSAATITDYNLPAGQNIIAAEVIMHYTPLFSMSGKILSAFQPQDIYKVSLYKPRQAALTTLSQH